MSIRVIGRQANGCAGLDFGLRQLSALGQRTGEIHVRRGGIRFQSQGGTELRNGFSGLSLRQQHPSQQVVPFGVAGYEFYELFESGAGFDQIATLYRGRSLPVKGISFAGSFLLLGKRRNRNNDEEKKKDDQAAKHRVRAALFRNRRQLWVKGHSKILLCLVRHDDLKARGQPLRKTNALWNSFVNLRVLRG